jgi:hypothetical protein
MLLPRGQNSSYSPSHHLVSEILPISHFDLSTFLPSPPPPPLKNSPRPPNPPTIILTYLINRKNNNNSTHNQLEHTPPYPASVQIKPAGRITIRGKNQKPGLMKVGGGGGLYRSLFPKVVLFKKNPEGVSFKNKYTKTSLHGVYSIPPGRTTFPHLAPHKKANTRECPKKKPPVLLCAGCVFFFSSFLTSLYLTADEGG